MSVSSLVPFAVLCVVFTLIAVRKIGRNRIEIWQAMTLGAAAVLLTGQIPPVDALLSINLDVILFLFGMFVVGEAMLRSGYLQQLTQRMFGRARRLDELVLLILFLMGAISAIVMNDTVAIIGTPVVLFLSRVHGVRAKPLLLTLAFAVTTGSVMSPIGNPQNLLVALDGGIQSPFVVFFWYLALPSLINLLIAFVFIRLVYRKEFGVQLQPLPPLTQSDGRLVLLSKVSLAIVMILIGLKVTLLFIAPWFEMRLTYIALIAALPVLLFSDRRREVLRNIDWKTLVFFAAMFILMESVWESGFFQELVLLLNADLTSPTVIMVVGVLLSQLISNVPLVALYLPLIVESGASIPQLMALASGSTIAGNMLILGAASNVIIIQNAEKEGATLTFAEFAKIGIPLTLIQVLVYLLFLPVS
ncbi:MAG: anion transporter [Candidatus Thorarchaeota archaeon]|nr:anion transporter [Candidatus Thorarchaeota archaeon]